MTRKVFSSLLAGGTALSLVAASIVIAGDPPPAAPRRVEVQVNQQPVAPAPAPAQRDGRAVPTAAPAAAPTNPNALQTFRAKEILGSQVSLDSNNNVGTVDDIVLDEAGNIDFLIVAVSDGNLITVPWDAAQFSAENRMAVVHIAPDKFQQAPTYTVKQYPAFATPTYRSEVYSFWGLTPGQERRAVRRATR